MTISLRFPSSRPVLAAVCALALLSGCAEHDAVRDLEEAANNVEILRDEVADAKQAVEDREGGLADAQKALEDAIEYLRETQGRLHEAEVAVAELATDDVLFRTVQASLIEELEDAAIAARVRDGVVTLTGRVEDPEVRDLAEEIARDTLGVLRVSNRIEIVGATPPPAAKQTPPAAGRELRPQPGARSGDAAAPGPLGDG